MKPTKRLNRRAFLTTTGLGAASLTLAPASAGAQAPKPPTAAEKANIAVVNKFLHLRWYVTPMDYNALREVLAEDCVRGGADPTSLEKGRDVILNNLKQRAGDGEPTRFTMLVQQWANGPIVTHERYEGNGGTGRDGRPASVGHGVGVFHVKDGKIKEWRWFQIENGPEVKVPAGAFKPTA
jgi:limonene-1,2-epoxide hydrolase